MCMYVRLIGSLAQNLFRRVGDDLADCAVFMKRGCVYKMRCLRRKFDDVGPDEGDGETYVALAEHQAELVSGLEKYDWFGHMDRKSAQEYVHRGGQGCFIVRPSSSTRSLTLTLRHGNRTYNILIRRRDDGLIALGSKKLNELVFRTVEEMCNHYASNELILYSGGELAGKTLLKFPCQVISQQPLSQVSSDQINHRSLALKLSLDSIGNIPKTLEESVHRAAQRSMSLRTFEETNTNNQLLGRNSSSTKKYKSKRPGGVNQQHRSYENVVLNNSERNNLSFHYPLGNSINVLNPSKLQTGDDVHQSYENTSHNSSMTTFVSKSESNSKTSLTSTGVGQKAKYNDQLNETGKEKIEEKQSSSRHFVGEPSRKCIKTEFDALPLTQTSNDNIENLKELLTNNEENSLLFTKSKVKNMEKLLIHADLENKLVNKYKLYENEKTGLSSTTLQPSPELGQRSPHKKQLFEILKEKPQPHCLPQERFITKDAQRASPESSAVIEELKQCCDYDTKQIHTTLQNPITANIKSSLASSEFVSKVIKTSLSDDSLEEKVKEHIKHSKVSKGLVKKNADSFKHKYRLKENMNHSSMSEKNVDLSVQVGQHKPSILRPSTDQTSDINYSQKNTKENIETKSFTNYIDGSVAISKENLFGTIQLVAKSLQNFQSEDIMNAKLKSNAELSKALIKELQCDQTQSKINENIESYLPSTVRKLNFINDQKGIIGMDDKKVYDSKLSQLETANQEPNDKYPKETQSKTKLAASFFEELAKKNQT